MANRPRTFDNLRGHGQAEVSSERTVEDDIRDLFALPMGQRVLAALIEESHAASPNGSSDAVLREAEGARRFVARLVKRTVSAKVG